VFSNQACNETHGVKSTFVVLPSHQKPSTARRCDFVTVTGQLQISMWPEASFKANSGLQQNHLRKSAALSHLNDLGQVRTVSKRKNTALPASPSHKFCAKYSAESYECYNGISIVKSIKTNIDGCVEWLILRASKQITKNFHHIIRWKL